MTFQEKNSSSVQDLAESAAPKELEVDKVECDMHQGHKVGASAVGELFRTVNKIKLLFIHIVVVLQCFNLNLMCFFNHCQEVINQFPEGDLLMTKLYHVAKCFSPTRTNRKNYKKMLKSHLYLSTNQLE